MFWIDTDNVITVTGLTNVETDSYVADASLTMGLFYTETVLNPDAVVAVDGTGGKTNIPVTAHGLTTVDYIHIFGTLNYDGEYQITSIPDADTIQITQTYVAETFTGEELIKQAVRRSSGTWPETLSYVAASNGNYLGQLPNEIYLFPDIYYELIITEVSNDENDQVVVKLLQRAGFKGF